MSEQIVLLNENFGPATKNAWQNDKLRLNIDWFAELSVMVKPKADKKLLLGETRYNGLGTYSSVVGEIPPEQSFCGDLLYWDELRNCIILQREVENSYESDWVLLKSTDGQPDFEVTNSRPNISLQPLTNTSKNGNISDMKKSDGFIDSSTSLRNALAVCDFASRSLDNSDKADDPIIKQHLLNEAEDYLKTANEFEEDTDLDEIFALPYGGLVAKAISLYKTDQLERSNMFIKTAESALVESEDSSDDAVIEDLPDPQEAYDIAESYLKMTEDNNKDYQTRISYTNMADVWLNIYNDLKTKARKNAEGYLNKANSSSEDIETRIDHTLSADMWLDKSEAIDKKELRKPSFLHKIKRIGKLALKSFKTKKP